MGLTAGGAVALAVALDRAIGEPSNRWHPVAWFGRAVAPIDRSWAHPTLVGAGAVIALPAGAAVAIGAVVGAAAAVHPVGGAIAAGIALFVTTSHRMLFRTARLVVTESESDPAAARDRLPALVGRDSAELSPAQIRSAAVESAAENLADGLVAPLLAFAIVAPVSLATAAAAAAWVKAINTLDSMIGYPDTPVGRVPARVDDIVMWIPARVGACLIAGAALTPGAIGRARQCARLPASPNAGWPIGTVAVAIDARLEKPGAYVLHEDAPLPTTDRARRGVDIVARAGLLAFLLGGAIALVDWHHSMLGQEVGPWF